MRHRRSIRNSIRIFAPIQGFSTTARHERLTAFVDAGPEGASAGFVLSMTPVRWAQRRGGPVSQALSTYRRCHPARNWCSGIRKCRSVDSRPAFDVAANVTAASKLAGGPDAFGRYEFGSLRMTTCLYSADSPKLYPDTAWPEKTAKAHCCRSRPSPVLIQTLQNEEFSNSPFLSGSPFAETKPRYR